MNLLSKTATKTFNLLGLGQRGVGKTVFLAGSYAELHAGSHTGYSQQLWLTCQDSQAQENVENILTYVARTGQYPPPTMKITDFNFNLKRHSLWGSQTLFHLRWWDIPGEICDIRNPDFRTLVPTSHGCCVFIDAYALVHKSAYLQALEEVIQQVMAIATLVSLNRLEYAFALILTKCDLLDPDPVNQSHVEESLQPLTSYLDTIEANYQTFYLNIPIVSTKDAFTLKATDAAAPFLWLVWELSKAHNVDLMDGSLKVLPHLLLSSFQLRKEPTNSLRQSLQRPTGRASGVKKILEPIGLRWRLLPITYKYILILAIAGAVGVIGLLLVDYEPTNQSPPAQQENTR